MSLALSSSLLAVGSASGTIVSSLKRKRAGQQEDQLHRSGHIHFSPSLPSYRYSAQHLTTSLASAEDSDKMPQPNPPPTPGSSSDLRGKDTADTAGLTQFRLPPTAYHDGRGRGSSTPSQEGSDSSYRPISPTATGKRPVGAVIGKEDFGLPPPPTRSHKFVKMKPQDEQVGANPATEKSGKAQKGGRKKQSGANGTTAAGRKTARKTAHSLIERRRRSKMNEEFGVLKEMIPACRGQDMHKLAILQDSIKYLRYLEQCVSDLQQGKQDLPSARRLRAQASQDDEDHNDDDEEPETENEQREPNDEEMPDSPQPTPIIPTPRNRNPSQRSLPSFASITSTYPLFSDAPSENSTNTDDPRHYSTSSASNTTNSYNSRHYSISSSAAASQPSWSPYFQSTNTSPSFGPLPPGASGPRNSSAFRIGSPALVGQEQQGVEGGGGGRGGVRERPPSEYEAALDREAAGGLLMLGNDARGTGSWRKGEGEGVKRAPTLDRGRGKGMSVRDLLSG